MSDRVKRILETLWAIAEIPLGFITAQGLFALVIVCISLPLAGLVLLILWLVYKAAGPAIY